MKKLNDLHSILLCTAAQRDSGSLYPLADTVAGGGARLSKALATLANAMLIVERETDDAGSVSRMDGDVRFGLYITAAGSAAIGVGDEPAAGEPVPPVEATSIARASKTSAVLALLQRDGGATLPELIAATGWLPHTTRAALTGLRKKGHAIDRTKRDGVTCYRIAVAA